MNVNLYSLKSLMKRQSWEVTCVGTNILKCSQGCLLTVRDLFFWGRILHKIELICKYLTVSIKLMQTQV